VIAAIVIAAALLLAAGATLAYLVASGRRVVRPGSPHVLDITALPGAVSLPASDATRAEGRYGLWYETPAGEAHALLGRVLDEEGGTVTRRVEAGGASLDAARRGRFTGHVFPDPGAASTAPWTQVEIAAPSGPCPAWVSAPPGASGEAWAIHIHGFGTTRVTALRTLPAASSAGLISLIPSFRGDGEGPPVPGGVSMLGQSEWADLEAAVEYAAGRGARRIILVGWSMGAAAAFHLVERSAHRELFAGLLLVAPVVDWRALIVAGARRAGLPAAAGRLTAWGLQRRLVDRMIGLPGRIDFAAARRAVESAARQLPILILHAERDPLVPFAASAELAARHPETVRLVPFDGVEHAWEYNQHPEAFDAAIAEWVAALER